MYSRASIAHITGDRDVESELSTYTAPKAKYSLAEREPI